MPKTVRLALTLICLAITVLVLVDRAPTTSAKNSGEQGRHVHVVTVPEADRFTPFALTIHAGDVVKWVNNDTDDHTVVSDDLVNTGTPKGIDDPLAGTDSNGGKAGTLQLRFPHAGTFVYYCKFHAALDAFNQPTAPGPKGGIQDANGNFGAPMMGVITVLSRD